MAIHNHGYFILSLKTKTYHLRNVLPLSDLPPVGSIILACFCPFLCVPTVITGLNTTWLALLALEVLLSLLLLLRDAHALVIDEMFVGW